MDDISRLSLFYLWLREAGIITDSAAEPGADSPTPIQEAITLAQSFLQTMADDRGLLGCRARINPTFPVRQWKHIQPN